MVVTWPWLFCLDQSILTLSSRGPDRVMLAGPGSMSGSVSGSGRPGSMSGSVSGCGEVPRFVMRRGNKSEEGCRRNVVRLEGMRMT